MFSKTLIASFFLAVAIPGFAHSSQPNGRVDAQEIEVGMQQAYEAGRNLIVSTESGHVADNFAQAWTTEFDGRGFLSRPNRATWSWGLALQSYGFEGQYQQVLEPESATSVGNRLTYAWGEILEEWYVNESSGLEHGFLLQKRPSMGAQEQGPLVIELQVQGGLRGQVLPGQQGLEFLDRQGRVVLAYAGLHVFDAEGHTQPARLVVQEDRVRIEVDERTAVYPLTIDPIAEQAYLKASNADANDNFGFAMSVSGDRLVVGAPFEDSNSTGVNGDAINNNAGDSGAAYVFVKVGSTWVQEAYLKASNTGIGDKFGYTVAISGDRIAVGALNEDLNTLGVNPTGGSDLASNSGAVYVFERVANQWTQTAFLKAPNSNAFHHFGTGVALHGDRLAVGAPGEDGMEPGVGGDPMNQDGSTYFSGAVFTYQFTAGGIVPEEYIKASNSQRLDRFGTALVLYGDRMVVGAPDEDSDSQGANGDQTNDNTENSGAVYVFDYGPTVWAQTAYLKPMGSLRGRRLGGAVTGQGDTVAFGGLYGALQVEVYSSAGGTWAYQGGADSTLIGFGEIMGNALALSGDVLAIGSRFSSSLGRGFLENPVPFGHPQVNGSGSVLIFDRSANAWGLRGVLKANQPKASAGFGGALAFGPMGLIVAAPLDPSDSTGVNGDPCNERAPGAGAVFVYDMHAPLARYCGPAQVNSSGWPSEISTSGSLSLADNSFVLHAEGLPLNQFGFFLSSRGQGAIDLRPNSLGTLCLGGSEAILRHNRAGEIQNSGMTGTFSLNVDFHNMPGSLPSSVGEVWNFQAWFRDGYSIYPSSVTDAVSIQIQ